jgi:1-phosphofructokinase
MILSVTVNPSVDRSMFVEKLQISDTNRVQKVETDAGGKGINLSRVVAELGGDTVAVGFIGGGPGAFVIKVLDKQGVRHDFVEVEGDTRTNVSVEDESKTPPTTFNEQGPLISEFDFAELVHKCRAWAPKAKWAAMGGSLPPGVPDEAFRQLCGLFEDAGCWVSLDADGEPMRLGVEAKPHFIKPNESETERLLGVTISSEQDAIDATRRLYEMLSQDGELPDRVVVVSRGGKGALLAHAGGLLRGISPKVEVRSTIGSGDSMVGAMLRSHEMGRPLEEAFRWGLAAGAATATTGGSEIARRPVIEDLLPRTVVEPI